jgi:putative ABC transport system permease protein
MFLVGSLQLGFIYSLLAIGVFITFRIMDTPDLTADGSFTLGLSVSAMFALVGEPVLGIIMGMFCGAIAGSVTGILHTKAGIHPILAGILVMTALYSINLFVMQGSPNVSLIGKNTVFLKLQNIMPSVDKQIMRLMVVFAISFLTVLILRWFFGTRIGLQIRATGNNEKMVRASSINADVMRIIAISVSNGCIGLSGAVLAQYQGYSDINSGNGIVIVGLASVIIGETFIRRRSITASLIAAATGAVIYRIIIALLLHLDFFPAYMLKLVSAVIVTIALASPGIKKLYFEYSKRCKKC